MNFYNPEKTEQLLKDFYRLTGIKIGICDSAERELCYIPKKLSDFCALLRADPEMDRRCRECDKKAFAECRRSGKQYVYTCHAGLIECISPVMYESKIIGFIIVGQIKSGKNDSPSEEIAARENRGALEESFRRLPSVDPDTISAAIRILDACTGYEYLKDLMLDGKYRVDVQVAGFVREHLQDDLSVKLLCSRFRLSHSELYAVFREYFNATPAEYIKSCRLSAACELLASTDSPVARIAKDVGVPDYNYFSKVFKKAFGISPRDYRKTHASARP